MGLQTGFKALKKLSDLLGQLASNYEEVKLSLLELRKAIVFVITFLSYIIAYAGVFVANALIHFVWSLLYVCSPLMILMYISKSTSFVTSNLYKGLIGVVVWKVLWSIMAVILLKMATHAELETWSSFLSTIVFNLCVGFSMLFIPIATKSLISDGMFGLASQMSMAPTYAAFGAVKGFAKAQGSKLAGKTLSATKAGVQPIKTGFQQTKIRLQRRWHKPRGQVTNKIQNPSNILYPNFNKKDKGGDDYDKT